MIRQGEERPTGWLGVSPLPRTSEGGYIFAVKRSSILIGSSRTRTPVA